MCHPLLTQLLPVAANQFNIFSLITFVLFCLLDIWYLCVLVNLIYNFILLYLSLSVTLY